LISTARAMVDAGMLKSVGNATVIGLNTILYAVSNARLRSLFDSTKLQYIGKPALMIVLTDNNHAVLVLCEYCFFHFE